MDNLIDSLLTADEVAAIFKIKRHTVYDWVKRGIIPTVRLGRLIRFRREDVIKFKCTQ
jgi:excisionase family DNA binding protein